MAKQATIAFYGRLTLLEIGQFKPITVVPLEATSTLAIDVPLTGEYLSNLEEVIQGQMSGEKPDPIWTDKGVQYIYERLSEMVNPKVEPKDFEPEDKPEEVSDEDW